MEFARSSTHRLRNCLAGLGRGREVLAMKTCVIGVRIVSGVLWNPPLATRARQVFAGTIVTSPGSSFLPNQHDSGLFSFEVLANSGGAKSHQHPFYILGFKRAWASPETIKSSSHRDGPLAANPQRYLPGSLRSSLLTYFAFPTCFSDHYTPLFSELQYFNIRDTTLTSYGRYSGGF